jgi:hypothetical protein
MNRFLLALLLPPAALGAEFSPAAVEFAPGFEQTLQSKYGAQEVAALRSDIVGSMAAALRGAHGRCNLNVDVLMERAAPTHPTVKQQLDEPSLDPFRSVFLNGGAALSGHVRGADGRILATVKHQHFVDDLRSVSAGKDPWSDARVAIEQFTAKLVEACKRQSLASTASR